MKTEEKLKKEDRCEVCEDEYNYPECRCTNCEIRVHWECVKNSGLGGDNSVSCPNCPGVIYK